MVPALKAQYERKNMQYMVDSLRMHLHLAKTKAKAKIDFDINHCGHFR